MDTSNPKQKQWTSPLSCLYSNYSKYQILVETDNSGFLDQSCPKKVSPF